MIHNLQTNGQTQPSIAEQRLAAYQAGSLPGKPVELSRRRDNPRAWLPWLAACALCLGILGAAYSLTPTVPSTAVRQVFVDVDGNGTLDLLLYGEVVLNSGPLVAPAGSSQP
jgi:hypothetical protein